jgi:hypothetical protein
MSRLRIGEALAGMASAVLFALLFDDWFTSTESRQPGGTASASGWSSLGWGLELLLGLTILAGVLLAVVTIAGRAVAWSVDLAVITSFLGIVTTVVLALRVVAFQPALDERLGNGLVDVTGTGWIGLILCALVATGGWIAMGDERTGSRHSAYTPPPARPVPPPAS